VLVLETLSEAVLLATACGGGGPGGGGGIPTLALFVAEGGPITGGCGCWAVGIGGLLDLGMTGSDMAVLNPGRLKGRVSRSRRAPVSGRDATVCALCKLVGEGGES